MVIIREIKMPLTIRAFTVPDANGDFNIYLNENLSDEAKMRSLAHEKKHIERNDFQSTALARSLEKQLLGTS